MSGRARMVDPAAAEALAVSRGVEETVALSRARGQAVVREAGAGRARRPYRRQSGLEWLTAKGRISAEARAAGERYAAAYRRVKAELPIRSSLDVRPGEGGGQTSLAAVVARGEATALARRTLAAYRARLWLHPDLVEVCDRVCGEGHAPRELAADSRAVCRVETLLKVALDVLAAG